MKWTGTCMRVSKYTTDSGALQEPRGEENLAWTGNNLK